MPALTEIPPQPVPAGEPEIPPSKRADRRTVMIVLAAIIAMAAGAAYYFAAGKHKTPEKATPAATAKTAVVTRGTLDLKVRVTGTTNARTYYNIVAPRLRSPDSGSMLLMKLAPSGTLITRGTLLAEFDPQSIRDHLDDTIAGYNDKVNDVKKKQVQLELDMETLRQSLLKAKAAVDKAKLDLQTLPVRTSIDTEILKLSLDEAQASYSELLAEEKLRKEAQKSDMRVTEISRILEEQHVERHQDDLARLTIKSPADGMVVVMSMFKPGGDQVTYAVGDRVYPGTLFMRIADPATMQLEGTINQAESSHFRIGQDAKVRLDAYPDAVYDGRVTAIGALATAPGRSANYYLRNLPIRVQVMGADKRVIPDLSGSAEILLGKAEDVLIAPASAVHQADGETFVYVKNGENVEKRAVTLGPSQGGEVSFSSGVSEGDVLVLN